MKKEKSFNFVIDDKDLNDNEDIESISKIMKNYNKYRKHNNKLNQILKNNNIKDLTELDEFIKEHKNNNYIEKIGNNEKYIEELQNKNNHLLNENKKLKNDVDIYKNRFEIKNEQMEIQNQDIEKLIQLNSELSEENRIYKNIHVDNNKYDVNVKNVEKGKEIEGSKCENNIDVDNIGNEELIINKNIKNKNDKKKDKYRPELDCPVYLFDENPEGDLKESKKKSGMETKYNILCHVDTYNQIMTERGKIEEHTAIEIIGDYVNSKTNLSCSNSGRRYYKQKIIRCFKIYERYKDYFDILNFSVSKMSRIYENNWPEWLNYLDIVISEKNKYTIIASKKK